MNNLSIVENGLIPVYQSDKGTRLVNMRELHAWLNVETRFNDWISRRIEQYGFTENEDFTLLKSEYGENTGFQAKDYIFKLEPAKEIAIVENNEKGKEIRRYFIKVEEKFKSAQIDYSKLSPELQMVQALLISSARLETEVKQLQTTQQAIKEAVISEPDNWREDTNHKMNRIAQIVGNKFQEIRSESYKLLESRAGVLLERRLNNLKIRLLNEGAAKSKVDKACKMDVIDEDKKLREIYGKIVSEYMIKYAC